MNMTGAPKTEAQLRDELDSLTQEANKLNEMRIRIEAELERAAQERAKLEEELKSEFGTAELDKLEALLREREAQNQQAVRDFRESIQTQRRALESIANQLTLMK